MNTVDLKAPPALEKVRNADQMGWHQSGRLLTNDLQKNISF